MAFFVVFWVWGCGWFRFRVAHVQATSESVEGLTATEEFAQAKEILDKARLTLNPNASSTASTTDAGETSSSSS